MEPAIIFRKGRPDKCHKAMEQVHKEKDGAPAEAWALAPAREREKERAAVKEPAKTGGKDVANAPVKEKTLVGERINRQNELVSPTRNTFLERNFAMPGGDRTGPTGMDPMTGRRAGFCVGSNVPGFLNRGLGLMGGGCGGGRGGRGRRNRFYATGLTGWQRAAMDASAPSAATAAQTAEAEKRLLEAQIGVMQSQLDEIKKRLAEFEAPTPAN